MAKLTKKPNRPVLTRITNTALVAGGLVVSACNTVGVPNVDSGPDVPMTNDAGMDVTGGVDAPGQDAPFVGVPPAPDTGSPDVGSDAPGTDAPAPGVPPAEEDTGPDGFVGV